MYSVTGKPKSLSNRKIRIMSALSDSAMALAVPLRRRSVRGLGERETIKTIRRLAFALCLTIVAAAAQAPSAAASVPDTAGVTILVRTTVVALNDANRTGNYTVFRDLGAPSFQAANTSARLGDIFADLRAKKLDLSAVVLFNPELARPGWIDGQGRLRLAGYFPTRPLRVNFDLAYEMVDGRWRLFGISIGTSAATAQLPSSKQDKAPARQ